MSTVTIVPTNEEFKVVTEVGGTVVISTNSVLQVGSGDLANYYTKGETDVLLAAKADVVHLHVVSDISDFSTTVLNGGVF